MFLTVNIRLMNYLIYRKKSMKQPMLLSRQRVLF